MDPQLERYIRSCCVRIPSPALGTGFFIGPGRVITCAHVVRDQFPNKTAKTGDQFRAFWSEQPLCATVLRLTNDTYPDLAELEVVMEDGAPVDAPCVRLGTDSRVGDPCYVPAYSERRPFGDGEDPRIGVTVDRRAPGEGTAAAQPGIKLTSGQISPGFSGAPVVNLRTRSVCAIVQWTRDPHSALGGFGLPVSEIATWFPGLVEGNVAFHAANSAWESAWRTDRVPHHGSTRVPLRPQVLAALAMLSVLRKKADAYRRQLSRHNAGLPADGPIDQLTEAEVAAVEGSVRRLSTQIMGAPPSDAEWKGLKDFCRPHDEHLGDYNRSNEAYYGCILHWTDATKLLMEGYLAAADSVPATPHATAAPPSLAASSPGGIGLTSGADSASAVASRESAGPASIAGVRLENVVAGRDVHAYAPRDPVDLEVLKAACALVRTGKRRGTGYLVAPKWVITCEHVVREVGEAQLEFPFGKVHATVRGRDAKADCAVLELDDALTTVTPLALDAERPALDAPGSSYGYPAIDIGDGQKLPSGLRIKVRISDPRAADERKLSAIAVYSDEISAGEGVELGGFSGSPVVVDGAVVGHLSSALGNDGRAQLGIVYVCPAELTLAMLRTLAEPLRRAVLDGLLSPPARSPRAAMGRHSLAEMPPSDHLIGREAEQQRLAAWSADATCRCILITGGAGMGKSLLAARLTAAVKGDWPYAAWHSFRDAPEPARVLADLRDFVSDTGEPGEPTDLTRTVKRILDHLYAEPVLVILDNLEVFLDGRSGGWLENYASVGALIEAFAVGGHRSRLILTSQQVPRPLEGGLGDDRPVRHLALERGLGDKDGAQLMRCAQHELRGRPEAWTAVVHHYRGNPMALTLVASAVVRRFGGDLDSLVPLLGELPFDPEHVDIFLERQLEHLKDQPLCNSIVRWLAIAREPLAEQTLRERLLARTGFDAALTRLVSLRLVEVSSAELTLVPQLMAVVTGRLIDDVEAELKSGKLELLHEHALVFGDASEHVRETQRRLFLRELLRRVGDTPAARILANLRDQSVRAPDYAAGNLWNLLVEAARARDAAAGLHMDGHDLSGLTLRDAQLDGITVRHADLSRAALLGCVLPEFLGSVFAIACGADGLIAAGDGLGQIHVWNAATRKRCETFDAAEAGWVWALAFAPRGHTLASGHDDGIARLWSLDRRASYPLEADECGHVGPVRALAFLDEGARLATTGNDGRVLLWDIARRALERELSGDKHGPVFSLAAVRHHGREFLVTGGEDGAVRLWDPASSQCRVLGRHRSRVLTVAAANGLAASAGQDSVVHLWTLDGAAEPRSFVGHEDKVWSIAFSPDGAWLASGGEDQKVRLWSVDGQAGHQVLSGHGHAVRAIAFAASDRLLSGSYDRTVTLWAARAKRGAGAALKCWRGQINQLRTVAIAPDGKLACGGSDGVIRVYGNDDQRPAALFGHRSYVWSVAFHPDGNEIASVSDDGSLRLWAVPTADGLPPRPTRTITFGAGYRMRAVAYDQRGERLACGSNDGRIRLFRRSRSGEWKPGHVLEGHDSWVWSLAFNVAGRLASASEDGTLALWDLERPAAPLQRVAADSRARIYSVCFRDLRTLATGGADHLLRLWRIDDSGALACHDAVTGHQNWIWSVRYTEPGGLLASGGADRTVRLWSWTDATRRPELLDEIGPDKGHTNWVRTVAFTADGARLASAGDDEAVKLWRIENGRLIFERDLALPRAWEDTVLDGVEGLLDAELSALVAMGARVR